MNSGKKCFLDEDACLEDFKVVLTLKLNMKPPVNKYFEEFANKLLFLEAYMCSILFSKHLKVAIISINLSAFSMLGSLTC